VIPLFHEQIRNGGPVTLTVPEMTRFLLPLESAVDTIFAALGGAKPGEIYVPNAPAATVLNIAKALIGDRGTAIRVVGIRPGEKMHEVLVSEEEVHHCVRRGDFYAVRSMLPELAGAAEPNALEREFSSGDNVMDLAGTAALLRKHRLMVDDPLVYDDGELLR